MVRMWNKIIPVFVILGLLMSNVVFAHKKESVSIAVEGQVKEKGLEIQFNYIAKELLDGQKYDIYLLLEFKEKKTFSANQLQLTLNGLRPLLPTGHYNLNHLSRWQKSQKDVDLIINLSDFEMPGNKSMSEYLKESQSKKDILKVRVDRKALFAKAFLHFVKRKGKKVPRHPKVVLDSVLPSGKQISAKEIAFRFHSEDAEAKFKCSFDNTRFAPCESPIIYSNLTAGDHHFAVRAYYRRFHGNTVPYQFSVIALPPPPPSEVKVVLNNVSPSISPTNSSTLDAEFSLSDGSRQAYCSLDGASPVSCFSPVHLNNLNDGLHKLVIDSKNLATPSAYSASYTWIVDRTAPVIQLNSAPALLVSSLDAHFEFSANEASSFNCSLDNATFQSCISPLNLMNLSEGNHELQIVAQDNCGNVSTVKSYAWTVDSVSPILSLIGANPQQSISNVDTLALTFTASETASYACSIDNGNVVPCHSPYSVTSLSEGAHQIEILATDSAGNVSTPLVYDWQVDLTPPHITVSMVSPTSLVSNMTSAEFSIVSSEVYSLSCFLDGVALAACGASLQVSGLTEGNHELQVSAKDAAGNTTGPVSFNWQIDLTAPQVQIISLIPEVSPTENTGLSVAFTLSEAGQAYCELDNLGEAPCSSPYLANNLADGIHNFTIRASDSSGNYSSRISRTWEVSTFSTASITSIQPSYSPSSQTRASFQFSSSHPGTFLCSLDSAVFSSCVSPVEYSGLTDGSHHFEVRAVNAQGKVGGADGYDWYVDATGPVVSLSSFLPLASPTFDSSFKATFQSNEAGSFYCKLDGGSFAPCSSPYSLSALSDGQHSFEAYAVDLTGNQSAPLSRSWFIDSVAPTLTIQAITPSFSPTVSSSLTLSFSSNETTSFFCTLDGGEAVACASPYKVDGLNDGMHTLSVRARDLAGNLSNLESYSWEVYSTPLVISNLAVTQITKSSALISWTTNIASNSQVQYGESILSNATAVDPNYVTSHSVLLTGLKSFTVYQFRAKSVDKDAREILSNTLNFRTLR